MHGPFSTFQKIFPKNTASVWSFAVKCLAFNPRRKPPKTISSNMLSCGDEPESSKRLSYDINSHIFVYGDSTRCDQCKGAIQEELKGQTVTRSVTIITTLSRFDS